MKWSPCFFLFFLFLHNILWKINYNRKRDTVFIFFFVLFRFVSTAEVAKNKNKWKQHILLNWVSLRVLDSGDEVTILMYDYFFHRVVTFFLAPYNFWLWYWNNNTASDVTKNHISWFHISFYMEESVKRKRLIVLLLFKLLYTRVAYEFSSELYHLLETLNCDNWAGFGTSAYHVAVTTTVLPMITYDLLIIKWLIYIIRTKYVS